MVAASAALLAVLAAGCSSDPDAAPTSSSSPSASSTDMSGDVSSGDVSTGASSATEPAALCPTAGDTSALTDCLADALGGYWSTELDADVAEHVVLHPVEADVPKGCRVGLTATPAFTCPTDGVLYFTDDFVASLEKQFSGAEREYAFAVVQAHEMGHVVQLHVKQPQIEQSDPDPDTIKFVEQQADCLSGVWAHAAQDSLGLDVTRFRAVADAVLGSISDTKEIATHGTPAERLAAIDRGLHGAGPAACDLTGSG